ncbi:MAG: hypothetical protein ACE5R6_01915 [Candidatus Heimdallarchaeota archaeon]
MEVGREKEITAILARTYTKKGWVIFKEFQIPGTVLNLRNSTGLIRKRLRPDLFGMKKGIIMAIEVENALFLHHATSYIHIANYCYLAYPTDSEKALTQETMEEQLQYARIKGIGIINVLVDGNEENNITELVPAVRHQVYPEIKQRIIQLAWNRYVRAKNCPL